MVTSERTTTAEQLLDMPGFSLTVAEIFT